MALRAGGGFTDERLRLSAPGPPLLRRRFCALLGKLDPASRQRRRAPGFVLPLHGSFTV